MVSKEGGRSKKLLENEIRPLIANFLKERGLELSPEKTKVTCITEGFDFWGRIFVNTRVAKTG